MAYTHKQTAAFVTTWQTSSTVAEVVCRLQEHPEFPNHLGDSWHRQGTRPLNMSWADKRACALVSQGVPLKDLPKVTARASTRRSRSNVDYTLLAVLARDLCPDND
jgi:hypothetical protein